MGVNRNALSTSLWWPKPTIAPWSLTASALISTHPEFDGFPMFSPDGTKLVWEGNRREKSIEDLDIYIADWVP